MSEKINLPPSHPLAGPEPESEPCPTPMSWTQVRDSYLNESEPWQVQSGGVDYRGRVWGSGPPVVLLNSLIGSSELYCLLAYKLQESHRCYLFDYPANAGQKTSASPTGFGALGAEILDVCDRLVSQPVRLYGAGYGGTLALEMSRQTKSTGQVVAAAVQAAAARRRFSWAERSLFRAGRIVPATVGAVPGLGKLMYAAHRRWFPPFDDSRFQFLLGDLMQQRLRDVGRRARLFRQADLRSSLETIHSPILLIRTEGDGPWLERSADELESRLPRVQVEHLHTSGHQAYLTHPHRVGKLVADFFTAIDGAVPQAVTSQRAD